MVYNFLYHNRNDFYDTFLKYYKMLKLTIPVRNNLYAQPIYQK